ncbi:MAG: hypothetical protein ACM3WU_08865 [Bacillota bacterium]
MVCELLDTCLFYNNKMPIESALGRMYKASYCQSNKEKCARHMVTVAVGRQFVDSNLYPNMIDKARRIINENAS